MGQAEESKQDRADRGESDLKNLRIDVPAELHRRMGQYRVDTGVTMSDQVRTAVDEWLRAREH